MKTADKVDVFYEGRRVGTIASYQRYRTAFEYSPEWLRDGFSISPLSLPLVSGVKIAKADPFEGLFGVFADSLPDGWGRLLVDRMLRKAGEQPENIGPLTRLCIVGKSGMGALEYRPSYEWKAGNRTEDLDYLAAECQKILQSAESEDLDTLYALGGSSGGARPKVMLKRDDGEWIIKFPSSSDPVNIGLMEYEYNLCARECGIDVPEVHLFPSGKCAGYFGSKRFDRSVQNNKNNKLHMASVSALLEVSHRIPSLDYTSLMALTWKMTTKAEDLRKMYALMCFNVYAHNRDDHSNNFSFIFDQGKWQLAPAYDLTYSNSMGGEHATTIAGEGRDPELKDLLAVAKKAGIRDTEAKETAERIKDTVEQRLEKYLE